MTGRLNHVTTHRKRRITAPPLGITALELAARMEHDAPLIAERWDPLLCTGPWIPSLNRKPADKLRLLVMTIVAGIAERAIGKHVSVDLEEDEEGRPIAILISRPGATFEVPVALGSRSLRIASEVIGLAARDAGDRILRRIADEVAANLGAHSRTVH